MMRSSRRVRTLWSRWQLSRGSHLDNVKGGRAHEVACLSELWRELCGGVSLLREEPWRKDQFNDAVCRSTGPEERSSGYGEVRAVCEHDDRRDGVDGQRCATGSFSADAQRVSFARRRQQRRGRTHLCAADRGGEVFMPMAETFFAFRFSMLRDRFGTAWSVIHQKPLPVNG